MKYLQGVNFGDWQFYPKMANSVSCQLIVLKGNPTFHQLKYLIEHKVALIQQVGNIEQCDDV